LSIHSCAACRSGVLDRRGPLDIEGFAGSGADWLERYKPFINDSKTVVVSPHKLYGPQSI
jgi:hypothetical protein